MSFGGILIGAFMKFLINAVVNFFGRDPEPPTTDVAKLNDDGDDDFDEDWDESSDTDFDDEELLNDGHDPFDHPDDLEPEDYVDDFDDEEDF